MATVTMTLVPNTWRKREGEREVVTTQQRTVVCPQVSSGRRETHPEDVVHKQPPQQDAASADSVQVQELHPVQGERQTKQVIGYPVL